MVDVTGDVRVPKDHNETVVVTVAMQAQAIGEQTEEAESALLNLLRKEAKMSFADIANNFRYGFVSARLGVTIEQAIKELGKKERPFGTKPELIDPNMRSAESQKACGAARAALSRALDKARSAKIEGIPPKDETKSRAGSAKGKTDQDAPKADAPAEKPAPVTVQSLVIPQAKTPDDVEHVFRDMVAYLRRFQAANAKAFTGERAALLRCWLMDAPISSDK